MSTHINLCDSDDSSDSDDISSDSNNSIISPRLVDIVPLPDLINNDRDDENDGNDGNYDENDGNNENDENNIIFPMMNNGIVENTINERLTEIMNHAYENMMNVNYDIINLIDMCYLKNLEYDDCETIVTISYTIKAVLELSTTTNFGLNELCANIFAYSILGTNVVFNENFEILGETLSDQLKKFLMRSYTFFILSRIFADSMGNMGGAGTGTENLEDVKMTLSAEEINKLPLKKYENLNEHLKSINNICTICRDNYETDNVVRILTCNHLYHSDCIDGWLGNHSNKCPHCRIEIGEPTPKI